MAKSKLNGSGDKKYLISNSALMSIYQASFPIISSILKRVATFILCHRAVSGDGDAAKSIAKLLIEQLPQDINRNLKIAIQKIKHQDGINSLWDTWYETRLPFLKEYLVKTGIAANFPLRAAAISQIALDNLSSLKNAEPTIISELVLLYQDPDQDIARQAILITSGLTKQKSIDQLCKIWFESRSPLLESIILDCMYFAETPPQIKVLTSLKQNRMDPVINGGREMMLPLFHACIDQDRQIANNALAAIRGLKNKSAINELCKIWAENREHLLEEAITHARYVASSPPSIRLLTALLNNKLEIARNIESDEVKHLIDYTQDSNPTIQSNAVAAATSLKNLDAIEQLCALFIFENNPIALKITQLAEYLPQKTEDQVLFLFLCERWGEYDVIDFDQRLMRNIYETAKDSLRQRIRQILLDAGKTAYLTILAGVDYKSKNNDFTPDEANLLIQVLSRNQEWQRLWSYITELALPQSINIINILAKNNWYPNDSKERAVFENCLILLKEKFELNQDRIQSQFPPAILRQSLKIKGRVNDLEFSPQDSNLAIGTGQKQVVIWNYQTGNTQKIIRNFSHSIGKLTYTQDGVLVCGERTTNKTHCSLFSWSDDQITLLGSYRGSINTLESVSQSCVVCTTRDGIISFWDLANQRKVSEASFDYWARAICVSEEFMEVGLFDHGLHLVSLNHMKTIPPERIQYQGKRGEKSVGRIASFTKDGDTILVGQNNGDLVSYSGIRARKIIKRKLPVSHPAQITGIQSVPDRNQLITSSIDGFIQFLSWPDLKLIGHLQTESKNVTSLHISKDSTLMATGTKNNGIDLWDLRVNDLPGMMFQPLSKINPGYLDVISALLEDKSFPVEIRTTLELLQLLMQFRLRFDIQICEITKLKAGEFDIIIDA